MNGAEKRIRKANKNPYPITTKAREIFTHDRIGQGLEYLQLEEGKNRCEDDTEKQEMTAKLSQADIELGRFQETIRRGVYPGVFEDAINELHERK